MNKLQALLIAGALGLASVSVQAATFNFVDYANKYKYTTGGTTASDGSIVTGLGEAGYMSFSAINDGLTVTATGANSTGAIAFAYLDAGGGLGVCSTGLDNASQCIVPSDDNVTANESVTLNFGRAVKIDSLALADSAHGSTFGGIFDIKVDGGSGVVGGTTVSSIMLATSPAMALGLIGSTFEFVNLLGTTGSEFYITKIAVSAVPVPAAGILFASVLLGAGALGRRKKKVKASVVGAFARVS